MSFCARFCSYFSFGRGSGSKNGLKVRLNSLTSASGHRNPNTAIFDKIPKKQSVDTRKTLVIEVVGLMVYLAQHKPSHVRDLSRDVSILENMFGRGRRDTQESKKPASFVAAAEAITPKQGPKQPQSNVLGSGVGFGSVRESIMNQNSFTSVRDIGPVLRGDFEDFVNSLSPMYEIILWTSEPRSVGLYLTLRA